MKQFKTWPAKAVAIARTMWAAGDSVYAISRAIGISEDTVSGKARRENWPGPPRPPRTNFSWSPDAIEAARRMWFAGDSASAIARALGVSRNAVLGRAWRGGWPHPVKITVWSPGVIDTAKRMWAAGNSASAIAKTIGTSRQVVEMKAWRERWPRLHRAA
jgi:hypothetical protein